jgi:hypothetical protein
VGHSRQRWGLENGSGSEALTGEGCQARQSRGEVAAPSSFRCSCARRRVRVVGGCYGRGELRREVADGGAHRRGALGGGEAEAAE